MPAFVTHLLISKETDFDLLGIEAITGNKNFFSLGSLGPDLPYYKNVFGSAIGTYFEERFNSKSSGFYLGHGDYFHSRAPNVFPMKLLEVIRKDNTGNGDNKNAAKLAFAYGYFSHMAADIIIHPYVNSIVGSYYLFVDNARKHRNVEIFLDRFVFESKFQKKLFSEDIHSWVNIAPEPEVKLEMITDPMTYGPEKVAWKEYAPGWFKSMVQRAFLESYSISIKEEDIEKWVSGFNSVLQAYGNIGPYHDLMDKKNSELANLYKEYKVKFKEDKALDYYKGAVKLTKKYIKAANDFYKSPQISNVERNIFLDLVPEADLTTPLM